jgi:hypothetical protein
MIGTTLNDRYQLGEQLGRGGTGLLGRRWEVVWVGPIIP